ncbi:MAG: hypothetical protein KBG15_15960 [Kofleriaceae bacterium]|nr:hypothetical protein [Kofleriaceae bacterium]
MHVTRRLPTLALCLATAAGLVSFVVPTRTHARVVEIEPPRPTSLTETAPLYRIVPSTGFIDDAIWSDGKILVYVITDAAAVADVHIVDVATKDERVVALPPAMRQPTALRVFGETLLVVNVNDREQQVAHWLPLGKNKKPAPRAATATSISLQERAGKPVLVLYTRRDGTTLVHSVEILDAVTGKRIAKSRSIETDGQGNTVASSKKMGFRINHWDGGYLLAYGIREGEFNAKEKQRSPNQEAVYDVIAGKFVATAPIKDHFEQRRRFDSLQGRSDLTFVAVSNDRRALETWQRGSKGEITGIDLAKYRTDSLLATIGTDGIWIGLTIDPANVAAIAQKKLDAEFFDIFHVVEGAATRVAHFPSLSRQFSMGWSAANTIWLTERNRGFSRGSKVLELVRLP